jgi:PBSX family phage portal protein
MSTIDENQDVILSGGGDPIAKMQGLSDQTILRTFILKSDDSGSKQILVDDDFQNLYSSDIAIEPYYYPLLWASLLEKNTRLGKLVRTYARNTVGLGWVIKSKKPITKDTKKKEKKQIQDEIDLLTELFEFPNPELPMSEVMYQEKVDEEATGNGYIEIVRDMKGRISSIYHIPSHTMRILKNLKGFVQIRGGKRRFFKNFGGEWEVDYESGTVKQGKNSLTYDRRGTEVIHFKIYSPRDSFYGIPRYVAAADAIAGSKLAARRNLSFFKNDATPRMAIVVQNGKLTSESIGQIQKFVNTEGKGPDNAHRAMILQAQAKETGGYQQKDVKIDVIPLTVGVNDDASHIKYRSANDEELRESFGVGEVFLGAKGAVNRATAMVSRAITNEQEFIPDAQVKEYKINQTIVRDFGVKMVQFEFQRPNSIDEFDKAAIFARYLQGGGITPNDIRHELGKDEYTENWGDVPIQIGLVEYQMGLLGAQGAASQGGNANDGQDANQENNGNANDSKSEDSGSSSKGSSSKKDRLIEEIQKSVQMMIDKNLPGVVIRMDQFDEDKQEEEVE